MLGNDAAVVERRAVVEDQRRQFVEWIVRHHGRVRFGGGNDDLLGFDLAGDAHFMRHDHHEAHER